MARTLWLGHKPFMITSQYFRGACVGEAQVLRKHPERLLREAVHFSVDSGLCGMGEWGYAIGAQLVPHLIWALSQEGRWPFFRIPTACELRWVVAAEARCA